MRRHVHRSNRTYARTHKHATRERRDNERTNHDACRLNGAESGLCQLLNILTTDSMLLELRDVNEKVFRFLLYVRKAVSDDSSYFSCRHTTIRAQIKPADKRVDHPRSRILRLFLPQITRTLVHSQHLPHLELFVRLFHLGLGHLRFCSVGNGDSSSIASSPLRLFCVDGDVKTETESHAPIKISYNRGTVPNHVNVGVRDISSCIALGLGRIALGCRIRGCHDALGCHAALGLHAAARML